jgi:hypothetical protein
MIYDAFLADTDFGIRDPSVVSECLFQKILKQYIFKQFPAPTGVLYNRSSYEGGRAWGYASLSLF